MIYATTSEEIEVRRKAFIRKWRLKHRAVADSLEEAGAVKLPDFPVLHFFHQLLALWAKRTVNWKKRGIWTNSCSVPGISIAPA
jgi:hypothetical protein